MKIRIALLVSLILCLGAWVSQAEQGRLGETAGVDFTVPDGYTVQYQKHQGDEPPVWVLTPDEADRPVIRITAETTEAYGWKAWLTDFSDEQTALLETQIINSGMTLTGEAYDGRGIPYLTARSSDPELDGIMLVKADRMALITVTSTGRITDEEIAVTKDLIGSFRFSALTAEEDRLKIRGILETVGEKAMGFAGTAGAQLKTAMAAADLLHSVLAETEAGDIPGVADETLKWLHTLSEDEREELEWNLSGVDGLIRDAFAGDAQAMTVFDDAGCGKQIRALTSEDGAGNRWTRFSRGLLLGFDLLDEEDTEDAE